ncbi:MAG: c-type cytochrome [Campylobacterota bacterium]
MRWIKTLAIASLLSVASMQAQQNEYLVIELKGEMGQELKALIQKYKAQIPQADISIVPKGSIPVQDVSAQQGKFANFDFEQAAKEEADQSNEALIAKGQAYYERRCQSCHGENADIKSYNRSRPLVDLSEDEFKNAIKGYKNGTYDRGQAFIMQPHARSMRTSQIQEVIAYINTLKEKEEQNSQKEEK